ncbi:1-phosphatidylinositol 4,5-bisphosphate phosphodiesterase classes I and II-like, partial [Rhagoletis pomonella]|uniref:1-phosphatidylinositol 4,5-bisphosphate phosphodiesterase classes I and II-like n=1 Tax=Rhagoletis pomonella TaxID=28610 RepID=UPI00178593C6
MRMAYSLARLNGSANTFLQKAHTKLCLQVDKSGKIPVRNIIKIFAQNKEDRKRVEKALDMSGLPSGKFETLSLPKFHFEDFFNLYKNLTQRSEVEKIFDGISPDLYQCQICCQFHPLQACASFRNMDVPERIEAVRNHKYCMNCL